MPKRPTSEPPTEPTELRIIGGHYRGTKLTSQPHVQTTGKSAGNLVTRPMKHRVREAIFNLVGPAAKGKHAIDVFAGTGALGLEAISRGAESATLIERHVPTATVVKQNLAAVGVAERCDLLVTSAFVWAKRDLGGAWPRGGPQAQRPWLAFVSPPYDFFVDRLDEMVGLVAALLQHAPPESIVVVEADERFDFDALPGTAGAARDRADWDVRAYPPAVVGVWRAVEANTQEPNDDAPS